MGKHRMTDPIKNHKMRQIRLTLWVAVTVAAVGCALFAAYETQPDMTVAFVACALAGYSLVDTQRHRAETAGMHRQLELWDLVARMRCIRCPRCGELIVAETPAGMPDAVIVHNITCGGLCHTAAPREPETDEPVDPDICADPDPPTTTIGAATHDPDS